MIASEQLFDVKALLQASDIRPTRQRLGLASLLFGKKNRHVTVEALHQEANKCGLGMALATVYNSLHSFTRAGLLREVVVDAGRRYFDTNVSHHHHLLREQTGELVDVDPGKLKINGLPDLPRGTSVSQIDVVIRIK
ncbi:MAG: transcriptional repressor [Pseudomonadota bacterium]|nr:transcriptional repressor [Pseudomonadota bacterium]